MPPNILTMPAKMPMPASRIQLPGLIWRSSQASAPLPPSPCCRLSVSYLTCFGTMSATDQRAGNGCNEPASRARRTAQVVGVVGQDATLAADHLAADAGDIVPLLLGFDGNDIPVHHYPQHAP